MLASCIDGEEDIFLEADGSARLKVKYDLPGMMLSNQESDALVALVEQKVAEEEMLELIENRVEQVNGRKVIRIEIAADKVTELKQLMDKGADEGEKAEASKTNQILDVLLGQAAVEVDGLDVRVQREVDLAPLLEQYLGSRGASLLGDSEFRYCVHLPEAALDSNAHETSAEGKTLRWKYKLKDCAREPIMMKMTAPIPVPWWVYMALIVLFLLGGAGLRWIFKKSTKKALHQG